MLAHLVLGGAGGQAMDERGSTALWCACVCQCGVHMCMCVSVWCACVCQCGVHVCMCVSVVCTCACVCQFAVHVCLCVSVPVGVSMCLMSNCPMRPYPG